MNTQNSTLAAGDLDPDFGDSGVFFTHFGPEMDIAAALGVNLAPDGKLLLCGFHGEYDYAVARLNADGTLDPGFGNAGIVVSQFKPGMVSAARTALVMSDQKLLVIGKVHFSSSFAHRALTRLNPDGSLDPSFGEQGSVILELPLGKPAQQLPPFVRDRKNFQAFSDSSSAMLQADGKIVLSIVYDGTAVTMRVNPDGSLDDSFGENGVVIVPAQSTAAQPAQFLDLIKKTDGNILGLGSTINVSRYKALMVGLDNTGSMDPAFNGGQGLVTEIGDQGCQWGNATVDSRSGLNVVCGGTLLTNSVTIVGRIDDHGIWDTGFGAGQGWVQIAVAPGFTLNEGVAVQSDGKILVCGAFVASDGSLANGFVFRLLG